ncbi:hypothetical protein KAFR_0J00320 [Kazachstania africana CBS 2517]|uniref:GATA-type domain-containing protein n=1 Tax=Kazachstania africana (strain ATCC 22294 / BCRC 22015 / CBS 2517 / CECT 1963 / NBRC 1671 / NRRL Y-8276) TaxID=1071382 RepID=H2B0F0_KAZAF|nr:hypothetical protein KAFR_0J00320 [Kazachstania africana CBS 2517]CCF60100.1 hypothetical protein KAFR_0J00320 [Kazachstania africana CBS 2517]
MLEALPDDINFGAFFTPMGNDDLNLSSLDVNSKTSSKVTLKSENDSTDNNNNQHSVMQRLPSTGFSHVVQTPQHASSNANVDPIDISNQQNGEIAQFWDFNVDTLQMTPSNSSDSATLSAPNSYSSDQSHFNNNNNNLSKNNPLFSNSYSNNYMNFISNNTTSSLFASSPSIPHSSNNYIKREDSFYKPSMFTKNNDPSTIPLSSMNTANSVRKNPITKQPSMTSLTNINKRKPSVSELSTSQNSLTSSNMHKKPQIQCFNCKTLKTPLWRRDPNGNALCNACGLFQKLHGTMRPLSLKTDVIKKRNSKKRAKKLQEQPRQRHFEHSEYDRYTQTDTININKNNNILPAAKNFVAPVLSTAMATTATTKMTASSKHKRTSGAQSPSIINNNSDSHFEAISTNNSNRISRRNSTSSNTSNRSSSSRSIVPILPKPSISSLSSSTGSSGNYNNIFANGLNDSNASSPRQPNSNNSMTNSTQFMSANSPLQPSLFSTSTSRSGITIPRRKLSRNPSYSSSFMAVSLHQLQNQDQYQRQPVNNNQSSLGKSSSSTITMNSWSSTQRQQQQPQQGAQPTTKPSSELFETTEQVQNQQQPHKSLLSQQLQNSFEFNDNSETGTIKESFTSSAVATTPISKSNSEDINKNAITADELDWLKFGI